MDTVTSVSSNLDVYSRCKRDVQLLHEPVRTRTGYVVSVRQGSWADFRLWASCSGRISPSNVGNSIEASTAVKRNPSLVIGVSGDSSFLRLCFVHIPSGISTQCYRALGPASVLLV